MDLTRIRKNIDDLDSMIITLLAKRADMVNAAGRLRKSEHHVRETRHIDQVLRTVRERAAGRGLDPEAAEEIYRTITNCLENGELKAGGRK